MFLRVYSMYTCTCDCTKYTIIRYRSVPEAHATKSRHEIHDHDGNLHLCDINPVKKVTENSAISFNLTI